MHLLNLNKYNREIHDKKLAYHFGREKSVVCKLN